MGIILIIPLPQMLHTTTTRMAIRATHQQLRMLPTAVPARMRPMEMMMGPVTTGGKSLITRLTPKAFTAAASTK